MAEPSSGREVILYASLLGLPARLGDPPTSNIEEEVQLASGPIVLPIFAGFLLTYATIAAPGAEWLRLLSFLPPLAPILMPARMALGTVSWWEMALAAHDPAHVGSQSCSVHRIPPRCTGPRDASRRTFAMPMQCPTSRSHARRRATRPIF